MSLLREGDATPDATPLKMSKSIAPQPIQPDVAMGYDALKRGDFAEA